MIPIESDLLRKWKSIVGEENIINSRMELEQILYDVGHFKNREVLAVIKPSNGLELQKLIITMKESHISIPLYPISTGKNWGQGSRKPTGTEKCVLIDLHRMNNIVEINLKYGYAIIEPGVTQWEISQSLQNTPYKINVTGSCKDSSIIGNIIDRGLGFNRLREDDLIAFEVILGNGKRIKIGHFSHNPAAALTWDIPFYAGPDMTSLFLQSNFGIVTSAIIQLIPRSECNRMVSGRISRSNLKHALDSIIDLKREGLFKSIIKVYNESAMKTYNVHSNPEKEMFGFYGFYTGRKRVVQALESILVDELIANNIEDIQITKEDNVSKENSTMFNWYLGIPDECESIHTAFEINHCNGDEHSKKMWIFFLPDLPASGQDVEQALNIIQEAACKFSVIINSTINIITNTSIRLVISIRSSREKRGIEAARKSLEYLYREFQSRGYFPSRYDIDHRNGKEIFGEGEYLETLKSLKSALDPEGIIAPSHYIP